MKEKLQMTEHRPWPPPTGSWVMTQIWHDLLFAHWPVEMARLRPWIPRPLVIDTFDGQPWVAVVPFRMTGIRLRATPALPWLSSFPELNVRTYVTCEEKPGVWFFSLDAGNPLAVAIARRWFHLPYFRAQMQCLERDGWVEYHSRRTQDASRAASLKGRYRAHGSARAPQPGSLEFFLTERYCLYAANRQGHLVCAEIAHSPWPLQSAEAEFTYNTMTAWLDIPLGAAPLLHFSKRQEVLVWAPRPIPAAAGEAQGSR